VANLIKSLDHLKYTSAEQVCKRFLTQLAQYYWIYASARLSKAVLLRKPVKIQYNSKSNLSPEQPGIINLFFSRLPVGRRCKTGLLLASPHIPSFIREAIRVS